MTTTRATVFTASHKRVISRVALRQHRVGDAHQTFLPRGSPADLENRRGVRAPTKAADSESEAAYRALPSFVADATERHGVDCARSFPRWAEERLLRSLPANEGSRCIYPSPKATLHSSIEHHLRAPEQQPPS